MKKIFQSKKILLWSLSVPLLYLLKMIFEFFTWSPIDKCGSFRGNSYDCSFFEYYSGGGAFIVFEFIFIFIIWLYLLLFLSSLYFISNKYKKVGYVLLCLFLMPILIIILGIIKHNIQPL